MFLHKFGRLLFVNVGAIQSLGRSSSFDGTLLSFGSLIERTQDGDAEISGGGEGIFDVWGGPGDDYIDGASECVIDRPFGGPGNDRIIQPKGFTSGGPGDDFIQFLDCGGTAYGDSGNDELRGGEDARVELHGGSGNDELEAFGGDELFGESGHDTLIGGQGETFFSCGPGIDTIIGFNAAEGDTKTSDCENF